MTIAQLRIADGLVGPVRVSVRSNNDGTQRRAVWVEFDDVSTGSVLGSTTSMSIIAGADLARAEGLPLILLLSTTGADINEGIAALHGWGQVAAAMARCSGMVPVIAVVDGPAVSGPALLMGLADLVVVTERSYAFVSGPVMVREFTGIDISKEELGSAASLGSRSGVASVVVPDRQRALEMVDELLGYLPDHVDGEPPRYHSDDPADRLCPQVVDLMPASASGSYDMRALITEVVDVDSLLEIRAQWATNVVTAVATLGGRPVGIVANNPISLAGTLDINASQKAARFVTFCDAFNLPIITLVDTPGFYPGKDLEWRGMIRHGAQLVQAYARASVPRICVIIRKSYGGAYIVMDSKTMGNDLCLAWPGAELAVMGAGQAAAILQRRASAEERAHFEQDYTERLLNPYIAAERGLIDAVIDPASTRVEINAALDMLSSKREALGPRKHDNTPL
jgi:acetyl-CoA carboxylase carboxyltransferase component